MEERKNNLIFITSKITGQNKPTKGYMNFLRHRRPAVPHMKSGLPSIFSCGLKFLIYNEDFSRTHTHTRSHTHTFSPWYPREILIAHDPSNPYITAMRDNWSFPATSHRGETLVFKSRTSALLWSSSVLSQSHLNILRDEFNHSLDNSMFPWKIEKRKKLIVIPLLYKGSENK